MLVNAQKLPIKQNNGLWVPANIKINGNADEWDNKFQAYNHATDLFYTLANNDAFIYLIVHAEDPDVITTISTYGFTFGIQVEKNANANKNLIVIQFPLFDFKNGIPIFSLYKAGAAIDTSASVEQTIMTGNNKLLQQKHKIIIVNGVAALDTLSIYNDKGIKVAESFDNKRTYTLEMAIPLKYIKQLTGDVSKFSYHMLINGRETANIPFNTPPGGFTPEEQKGVDALYARINKRYARTDFWGEYTLAKKP